MRVSMRGSLGGVMSSTVQPLRDTISDTLATLRGPALIVYPSDEIVDGVVDALREVETLTDGPIRILATPDVLKTVRDTFTTATAAAALAEEGRLSLRASEDPNGQFLLVTSERVHTLLIADDATVSVIADDDAFVEEAYQTYDAAWEAADEFDLRTPGLTRLLETLESEINEATRDDFESMLRSLPPASAEYNEVELSILAAAKNRVLLYDLSRWGENVGLASKATFSRTKTRLEDQGYVATEKVPIDVGRPRLRLTLTEEGRRSLEHENPTPFVSRSDA